MKRRPGNALLLFILVLLAHGCSSSRTASGDAMQIKEVAAIEDKWMSALVNKDTAYLSSILTDNFTLSASSEDEETKVQYLQTSAMSNRVLEPITLQSRKFKRYGITVISTGKTNYKGHWKDRKFDLPVRYTNVFVKVKGHWKISSVHMSILN